MAVSEAPRSGILRAIRSITAAKTLPALTATIQHAVEDLTGADDVAFVLSPTAFANAVEQQPNDIQPGGRFFSAAMDACMSVIDGGEPLVIEDVGHGEHLGTDAAFSTGSLAIVPAGRGGAIGAYWAAPSLAGLHLELLHAIADAAALTLENIQLTQRVRESDARFRLMADTSPVMIWVTDAAGGVEFVNRAYCNFFGVREADVQGPGGWQPLVHPDDAEQYLNAFLQSLRDGTRFFAEARVRRADGQWRWIASYAAPRLSADGHVLGAVGSSPDVTEIKEAELALKTSEQRLHTIIDSTSALIYVVDGDGRFALINREFGRLFNIDPRSVAGKSLYDCFPGETADQFVAHNRTVIETGKPLEFEEVVQQQDGVHHYVSVKAPLLDEANRPVGICGVSTDITSHKRLLSALERAHREKDAFVATLGHELRQPLSAIQAALGVLRMRTGQTLQKRARQVVERQVTQLTRLVDDLLDAARVAQGKVELRRERMALNTVLDAALAVALPAIQQADQSLEVSIPADPIWVNGDATRLQQVFSNLLTNATKFTDPRGRIVLRAGVMQDTAVVTVSDTGRGIAATALPHIFDLFAQADSDRAGLGIGLSVVRGLVQRHGGSVEAQSGGTGLGSEFVVRLPLAADA